jgi:aldose 1-epimerase
MLDDDGLLTIRNAASELVLAPRVGGSVVSFRVEGADILRSGTSAERLNQNPTGLAAFPLVPFSGRIANARFSHQSREIVLEANFPPEPHAIHGQGWQNVWQVAASDEVSATLVFEHAGRDWPWRYRAEQHFRLAADGLTLSLSLRNQSDSAMPAGIGWHPYFPKAQASLSADVKEIWTSGIDMIPAGPTPLDEQSDLRSGRPVTTLDLDNNFSVGESASVIEWSDRRLRATLSAGAVLRHLVVYTPPAESYFCVEPTTHAPDAVNSEGDPASTGYRELQPGEILTAEIALTVEQV